MTRDLKHPIQHDELYQMRGSKTSKNVILKKWGAPFFYPETTEKKLQKTEGKIMKKLRKKNKKKKMKKMIRFEAPEIDQKSRKNPIK